MDYKNYPPPPYMNPPLYKSPYPFVNWYKMVLGFNTIFIIIYITSGAEKLVNLGNPYTKLEQLEQRVQKFQNKLQKYQNDIQKYQNKPEQERKPTKKNLLGGEKDPEEVKKMREMLPDGWAQKRTEEGRLYYVDHSTKTTQWKHPIKHKYLNKDYLFSGFMELDVNFNAFISYKELMVKVPKDVSYHRWQPTK
jgi:hypothetical protein